MGFGRICAPTIIVIRTPPHTATPLWQVPDTINDNDNDNSSLYTLYSISILLHYIYCYIVFFFPEMSRRLERERYSNRREKGIIIIIVINSVWNLPERCGGVGGGPYNYYSRSTNPTKSHKSADTYQYESIRTCTYQLVRPHVETT